MFYDLTSLEDGVPCYIRIKSGQVTMTFKAIPRLKQVEYSHETVDATNGRGCTYLSMPRSRNVEVDVGFSAIPDKNNVMFTVEM